MGIMERETVEKLNEQFNQLGIKSVLFDLDGTLVDTTTIFQVAMFDACEILLSGEVADYVSEELRQPYELNRLVMNKVVQKLRPEFKVNPAIMVATVRLTAQRLGLGWDDECVDSAIERIRRVHIEVPPLFTGAVETINMINATGVDSILATHSEEPRVRRILDKTELAGRFGKIICFDVNYPKFKQWEAELRQREIDLNQSLVIGDSWKADIKPMIVLGTRAVWVGVSRRVEDEGAVDGNLNREQENRILRVGEIGQAVEAILSWDHS